MNDTNGDKLCMKKLSINIQRKRSQKCLKCFCYNFHMCHNAVRFLFYSVLHCNKKQTIKITVRIPKFYLFVLIIYMTSCYIYNDILYVILSIIFFSIKRVILNQNSSQTSLCLVILYCFIHNSMYNNNKKFQV